MASNSEKMALVAPMPSASEVMVKNANARLRRSRRSPKVRSRAIAEEACARHVPRDLLDQRHVAEIAPRGGAGVVDRLAAVGPQLRFARQVEGDLVVEVALVARGAPQPLTEPPQRHALLLSNARPFITRAMTSTIWFQRDCSAASCFRPAAVRR
jgi:hypothetical protein